MVVEIRVNQVAFDMSVPKKVSPFADLHDILIYTFIGNFFHEFLKLSL